MFQPTDANTMLEEALDPRPAMPPDFARLLTGSASGLTVSADVLAQVWNDDVSYWSNIRTLEYWIDRARG